MRGWRGTNFSVGKKNSLKVMGEEGSVSVVQEYKRRESAFSCFGGKNVNSVICAG